MANITPQAAIERLILAAAGMRPSSWAPIEARISYRAAVKAATDNPCPATCIALRRACQSLFDTWSTTPSQRIHVKREYVKAINMASQITEATS